MINYYFLFISYCASTQIFQCKSVYSTKCQ